MVSRSSRWLEIAASPWSASLDALQGSLPERPRAGAVFVGLHPVDHRSRSMVDEPLAGFRDQSVRSDGFVDSVSIAVTVSPAHS
jgi:hypothetical protein